MARTFALLGSLAIICLLAFLTVSVAMDDGIDILVVVSAIILALLGIGILGALDLAAARWLGAGRHHLLLAPSSRAAAAARAFRG